MPTSANEDGRPTQGGAALPVHIMNPGSISGGGGGGGPSSNVAVTNFPASQAVTIADGADVAEGVTTDAAVVTDANGTVSGKLRGLVKWAFERMPASLGQKAMAAAFPVSIASDQSALPVTGTFFQGTQPVSAATLPLPTGASTSAQIGEVQASPTANTVLDRLKALLTGIILAAGEAFIGKVGGSSKVVEVTPTLTVAATYVANDYVGTSSTAMVFANMGRVNGATVTLMPARLLDKALQSVACELWLFDTAITPPADSAAWSISDADAAKCVAVLTFSTYYASALNSMAFSSNPPMLVKCASADTSLYGCLVTRGAPAYANGDLVVALRGYQD